MGASRNSVSIRIGTDGKATVIRDFDEMAVAGGASADRLRAKWENAVAAVDTAVDRANKAAQRLAAVNVNPVQANIDASTGVTGGQGQAAALASAMSLAAGMQQAEQQARQLLAAIDPVLAAQMRYGDQVARLDQLLAVGGISEANYQRLLASEVGLLDQVTVANSRRAQQEALGAEMAAAETAQMERQQAAARALISAVDPLYAAQQRYNQQAALAFELFQADALSAQRYGQVMLGLAAEVDAVTRVQALHGRASGASNIAMMELEHVVRGSSDAFAAGAPPLQILTMHIGMLAQAASLGGESMGAFGRFMGGGWGILLTAAVSILGALAAGHYAAGAAADHQRTAEDDLREAIEAERHAIQSLDTAQAVALQNARATADALQMEAQRRRDVAAATLQQVIAANQAQAQSTDNLGVDASGARIEGGVRDALRQAARDRIADARQELEELQAANAARQGSAGAAGLAVVRRVAQDTLDVVQRTTDRFGILEHNLGVLERHGGDPRLGLIAPPQIIDQLRQVLGAAMPPLDRPATAAEQNRAELALGQARREAARAAQLAAEAERRVTDARQSGRQVTMAEAAAIVQAAGGHVSSTGRSHEEQARLYRRYLAGQGPLAAPPGSSAHEGPNPHAIDFTGLSLGQVRELLRSQGITPRQLLLERNPATGGTHVHWDFGAPRGEAHAETLARQSESRVADTAATLREAQAYLQNSTAAAQAEAARRGLTDATRQGTDASVRIRQEQDLETAQTILQGARNVAQMRDEAAARTQVNDRIAAGTLNVRDMQQQLQDEAQLRPLLARQALAHGEALRTLTETIDAMTAAQRRLHEEEAHGRALVDIMQLRTANDNAREMLGVQAPDDHQRAVAEAVLRGAQEARDKGYTDYRDIAVLAAERGREEQLNQARQTAEQMRRLNADQEDRNTLLTYELHLGDLGEQQRQNALNIEQQRLQLQRQFGREHQAEIELILAKTRAEQELQAQVERARAAMQEFHQFGGNVIDDLFNVDNWSNWGQAGLRVLHMIEQEFITLALANPLKNMLLGENNPTLGSVFRLLTGAASAAAGGKGAGLDALTAALKFIPSHFAAGTDNAPGGLALIGEMGPEIMNVPRGASITPAADTRRLLAANDAQMGSVNLTINNDYRGVDPQSVARLEASHRRMEEELPGRVLAAMSEARQRNLWRGK